MTIIGARITREKPGLRWWVHYAHGFQQGPIAHLRVSVEGHEAQHLVTAHLTWENSGATPLMNVPFTWKETRGGQLISRAADPKDRVEWQEGEHGAITLLNPGEMVCCDLVYINSEHISIKPEARAPGVTAKPYRMSGTRLVLHLGRILFIQLLIAVGAIVLGLLLGVDPPLVALTGGLLSGVAIAMTFVHYLRSHRRRTRNKVAAVDKGT